MSGHVRVYFRHGHKGSDHPDCCMFNILHSGALALYGNDGNKLIRAYAPDQWVFVTMVYTDEQGDK